MRPGHFWTTARRPRGLRGNCKPCRSPASIRRPSARADVWTPRIGSEQRSLAWRFTLDFSPYLRQILVGLEAAGSQWLVPVSAAFSVGAALTLAVFISGPGCQTRCFNDFDCGEGSFCAPLGTCETECFTNYDCRMPPECSDNPAVCQPRGFLCNPSGRCVGSYSLPQENRQQISRSPALPTTIQGWDDPPGAGNAFIVDRISIAGAEVGFDIDGNCDTATGDGCVDNVLSELGDLGNDQIRQGLISGESLLLLELAGLDSPYRGDDSSLTVKLYGARDADDPPWPADNFNTPPGYATCCQFSVSPQSIDGPPDQARSRAPARIERGRLFSLAPVPIQFTLTVGLAPHPEIRMEKVLISGRLPSKMSEFNEGLLGGSVPVNTLMQTRNPYCQTISSRCTVEYFDSTLLDLVATLLNPKPDIDLDRDGSECLVDTDGDGRIDRCCDGAGIGNPCFANGACIASEIAAIEPRDPSTCALSPTMADGYSVALAFSAVAAEILAVGQ